MRLNLSSMISLSEIPERYYRPQNTYEETLLRRFENIPTNIYRTNDEAAECIANEIAKDIRESHPGSVRRQFAGHRLRQTDTKTSRGRTQLPQRDCLHRIRILSTGQRELRLSGQIAKGLSRPYRHPASEHPHSQWQCS